MAEKLFLTRKAEGHVCTCHQFVILLKNPGTRYSRGKGTTLVGAKDKHRYAVFLEDFTNCHFGQFFQQAYKEVVLSSSLRTWELRLREVKYSTEGHELGGNWYGPSLNLQQTPPIGGFDLQSVAVG